MYPLDFFVTRAIDRPSYSSAELLPERIVSASRCHANFIPDTWCIEWSSDSWKSRAEEAREFALSEESLAELTAWVTPQLGSSIGWPNTIYSDEVAAQLVEQFLDRLQDVKVLEIALHSSLTETFCSEVEPPPQQPGYAPNGRQGIHEAILEGRSPSTGGSALGLEPLVFNHHLSCSWLCNSLEVSVAEHLGIFPNSSGMISSFEDAYRCIEYIQSDDVGAEPGLWLPWLIIEHPGETQAKE